jgi:glucose uptake protein
MFRPQSYTVQLALMITSMCCWGSWANTVKLTPGWRFQSFYWDYVIGLLLASVGFGFALGGGTIFFHDLVASTAIAIVYAVFSGVIFNAANQLLVAAIDIAGLAVAFPIGIGLALIIGVVFNYILQPAANPIMLFVGVALVVLAVIVDAMAYRSREKGGGSVPKKGIIISLLCGVMMGLFYPFLTRAMQGSGALNEYTVVPFFAAGVALCALPMNFGMMRKPFTGTPVAVSDYTSAKPVWHLWGIFGGAIWCAGLSTNLISSRAQLVGPAVSYAIGQGATMVSAAWGVFIWREFRSSPRVTSLLISLMFLLFILGLTLIALAPQFVR